MESPSLTHNLFSVLPKLAAISTRKELHRHPLYQTYFPAIQEVLSGLEWSNSQTTPSNTKPHTKSIGAVAWNIERGIRLPEILDFIQSHPELSQADLLLLTETDIGMGRSGNENIPRRLAEALHMNYVFANGFLNLTPGDEGERGHGVPNTLSLHGVSLLSRFPIRDMVSLPLHQARDYFHVFEKRLGNRRALIAKVDVGSQLINVVVAHLEVHTSARVRAKQMEDILRFLPTWGEHPTVIGGDLNTSTYDLNNRWGLLKSIAWKLGVLGFRKTLEHYLEPQRFFERKLFRLLRSSGFDYESCNDLKSGTFMFNLQDTFTIEKTMKLVPAFSVRWLMDRLTSMNGQAPLRLDWFATRGLDASDPKVFPFSLTGKRPSDHFPILVRLNLSQNPLSSQL